MEQTITTPSSKTFLGLPLELRNRIYEEVFAGSQISLEWPGDHPADHLDTRNDVAALHDFLYSGPENYTMLLVCSQVKREATPVLRGSLCLYIDTGYSYADLSPLEAIELYLGRSSAPRSLFLQDAMLNLKRIKFKDQAGTRIFSDLCFFPQLREIQLIVDLWTGYCPELLPDNELVQNPLLILGHAHDHLLIKAALQISQHHYLNANLASCLKAAASGACTYQVILKSHIVFLRPPSVYEPAGTLDWDYRAEGWDIELDPQMVLVSRPHETLSLSS